MIMELVANTDATLNVNRPLSMTLDDTAFTLQRLSRGGCANTYIGRAEHASVAPLLFKVPHPAVIACDRGLRQWQQECSLLSSLRHPAIPSPVAIGAAPQPFMAYPLLPGSSLRRRNYPPPERSRKDYAVHVGLALLRILGYLHHQDKPIAHGDVRPDNVLIDRHGYVRLIDFGCAQPAGFAGFSPWIAAPRYLSPEQARGMPWGVRSDLYQVGLIVYELAMGEVYNRAGDTRQAILRASSLLPLPIRRLKTALGRPLAYWLCDLLAPRCEDRLPSADCAAKMLLALLK